MSAVVEDLVHRLGGKRSGKSWIAKCPAHDDHTPSLSISEGRDGSALLKCHAGCSTDDVLTALGLTKKDLFPLALGRNGSELLTTYDYVDEGGQLLFQVCRFAPKTFRQRRPDGKGGWIWKLEGVRRVLYRLPEVIAAQTVAVTEG